MQRIQDKHIRDMQSASQLNRQKSNFSLAPVWCAGKLKTSMVQPQTGVFGSSAVQSSSILNLSDLAEQIRRHTGTLGSDSALHG
jgi:hypothetical protein